MDAHHIISDVRAWLSASKAFLLCFFRYFQKLLSSPQIFHDAVGLLLKAFRNLSTTLCTLFMQFRFSAESFFNAGLQVPVWVGFCGTISDDCEVRELILENWFREVTCCRLRCDGEFANIPFEEGDVDMDSEPLRDRELADCVELDRLLASFFFL